MTHNDSLGTVKRLYAAFGTGDLPGLLGVLDTSVEWSIPGNAPWSGDGRGPEHVQRFFETFGTHASLTQFEPRTFVADGNTVVVLGYEEGAVRKTGRGWKAHFTHVFTVEGNKVIAHREYVDTQAIAEAFSA